MAARKLTADGEARWAVDHQYAATPWVRHRRSATFESVDEARNQPRRPHVRAAERYRARGKHRPGAAPSPVALSLQLWQRAGSAGRVASGRPHAIMWVSACRTRPRSGYSSTGAALASARGRPGRASAARVIDRVPRSVRSWSGRLAVYRHPITVFAVFSASSASWKCACAVVALTQYAMSQRAARSPFPVRRCHPR